jgi:Predicted transcriptional regulator
VSFTRPWLDDLAAHGRSIFSLAEAAAASRRTSQAAYLSLNRARKQGLVYSPASGLWVIVPPEYRSEGAPPWRLFLDPLLRRQGIPYYLGLLSAASQHGASGQSVQVVQVVADRPKAPIVVGRQRIVFVMRRNAAQAPVDEVVVPAGRLRVSTPSMTALDLVTYRRHAGGLGNVASVLRDLDRQLTAKGMREALRVEPATTDVQRLGYLLERIGLADAAKPLAAWLKDRPTTYIPLVPGARRTGDHDARWRVIVNAPIELD